MKPQGRAAPRRAQNLAAMGDLLAAARYEEALALWTERADLHADLKAQILAAHVMLKRDDAPAAIGLLAKADPSSPRDRAERLLLLATAYTRAEDFETADDYFDAALEEAAPLRDPDLRAQIAYRRGRRYALARDIDAARRELTVAKTARSRKGELEALFLEAWIAGVEQRLRDQSAILIRLLDRIDPRDATFAELAAHATHTLAALSRELFLPEALGSIDRHLRDCRWPADLNLPRFQALKAFGWAHALRGDYFTAFRHIKAAIRIAPGAAWLTMAHVDLAYLARCVKEHRWSRQELAEADELAQHVQWTRARNEEPVTLLLLAELFAPIDRGKAAAYLTRYQELGELNAPLVVYNKDERLTGLADYSSGVVHLALGNPKSGIRTLKESLAIYERFGYDWRAGRSALRLYEATRDKSYLKRAEEKLQNYLSGWLGDELRELATAPAQSTGLPPMQERVFRCICRGMSNAEIAKELGRSGFTVQNHIKQIFKTFGVNSRAALIAQAMQRRII